MTRMSSNKTTNEKKNNKKKTKTKPIEMMMNALALSRDLWKRNKNPQKKKKQMHPKSMKR